MIYFKKYLFIFKTNLLFESWVWKLYCLKTNLTCKYLLVHSYELSLFLVSRVVIYMLYLFVVKLFPLTLGDAFILFKCTIL